MPHNKFNNLKNLILPQGGKMKFYSLPELEKMGFGKFHGYQFVSVLSWNQ